MVLMKSCFTILNTGHETCFSLTDLLAVNSGGVCGAGDGHRRPPVSSGAPFPKIKGFSFSSVELGKEGMIFLVMEHYGSKESERKRTSQEPSPCSRRAQVPLRLPVHRPQAAPLETWRERLPAAHVPVGPANPAPGHLEGEGLLRGAQ